MERQHRWASFPSGTNFVLGLLVSETGKKDIFELTRRYVPVRKEINKPASFSLTRTKKHTKTRNKTKNTHQNPGERVAGEGGKQAVLSFNRNMPVSNLNSPKPQHYHHGTKRPSPPPLSANAVQGPSAHSLVLRCSSRSRAYSTHNGNRGEGRGWAFSPTPHPLQWLLLLRLAFPTSRQQRRYHRRRQAIRRGFSYGGVFHIIPGQ